jgi:hypothetical protein
MFIVRGKNGMPFFPYPKNCREKVLKNNREE